MNAPFILCLVACIGCGIYALYLRNLERPAAKPSGYLPVKPRPKACWPCADKYGYDFAAYHIFHGPTDGCIECEDK